jgi:hypothetical protein
MTRAIFVIPGDIDLPTGGYAYDRRLLALFADHGIEATHLALPGTYPDPSPADLEETRRLIAGTRPSDILLIDGDPLTDITILQDKARILAVMKDGEFHRAPPVRHARTTRWAA